MQRGWAARSAGPLDLPRTPGSLDLREQEADASGDVVRRSFVWAKLHQGNGIGEADRPHDEAVRVELQVADEQAVAVANGIERGPVGLDDAGASCSGGR